MQFPHPDARIPLDRIQCQSPSLGSRTEEQKRIVGSLIGLAIGDAAGAAVEFRPRDYLVANPVKNLQGGGTWGLQAGQWTDDTSMALCLASSLVTRHGFDPYDQMVRYKWWHQRGFLSSTGKCFDIGGNTRLALDEFCQRQNILKEYFRERTDEQIDGLSYEEVRNIPNFDIHCGKADAAGNGALMRLAPVPLYYFREPEKAVKFAGESARITHGDPKAVDACRYYAALIVAAVQGEPKARLLSERFYEEHKSWFGQEKLHDDILKVARGSYKKPRGYEDGIRGKNFIVNTLEAALWAFAFDNQSFIEGVLNAVNLGDDTDTTAAVYGQLAGAHYGLLAIPPSWTQQLFAVNFIICVADWLYADGNQSRNNVSRQQSQQEQYRVTPQQPSHRTTPQQPPLQERITPQLPSTQRQSVMSQHSSSEYAHLRTSASQQNMYSNMSLPNQQTSQPMRREYMGYGPATTQRPPRYAQTNELKPTTSNDFPRRKEDGKLDPASLPPAGVSSGQHHITTQK